MPNPLWLVDAARCRWRPRAGGYYTEDHDEFETPVGRSRAGDSGTGVPLQAEIMRSEYGMGGIGMPGHGPAAGTDDGAGGPAWPLWPVAAALAVAWTFLAWPWLGGRFAIPWDAKAHFQPQVQFLAGSLARGESPFWNPYVFSGQPQIADPQSLIFSPPFLALSALNGAPSSWAVDTTLLVMVLLGGLAVLVLFRDRGWDWTGALLAAIAFAFGASMAWRIQHTGQVLSMVYLLWLLVVLERLLARPTLARGALAGLLGACLVLGRDQVALLGVYLLAGRVVWHVATVTRPLTEMRRLALPLAVAAVLGLALIALPILWTLALASQSNRPSIDLEGAGRGSLHPALLVTMLVPDLFGASGRMEDYWGPPSFAWSDTGLYIAQNMGLLYIGAVPVLLLLLGALRGHLWAREVRYLTVALIVLVLYALGWYTPVLRMFHAVLPGISLYRRPADATFLIGALAAILAGYCAHRGAVEARGSLTRRESAVLAAVILAGLGAGLLLGIRLDRLERALAPLGVAALALGAGLGLLGWWQWARVLWPWQAGLVLCAALVADLAWSNGPSTSSALPAATFRALDPAGRDPTIELLKRKVADGVSPARRDRVELVGLGFHWPNASLPHRLEHTLGYNPVRLDLYSRATGAQDTVGLPEQRTFSKLLPSYNSRLADLLGLRWIATSVPIERIDKGLTPGSLPLVGRTPEAYLYENPRALPRVILATRAQEAHFAQILETGAWPDFDPATTVLLERLPGMAAPEPARRPGRASIRSYRNTEIVVDVDSPDGGHLVLNDVWHPWWYVEVDGRPVPTLRANVLFRAVEVPAGAHSVTFTFQPLRGLWDGVTARWSDAGSRR